MSASEAEAIFMARFNLSPNGETGKGGDGNQIDNTAHILHNTAHIAIPHILCNILQYFSQYVRYLAHIFHFVQCAICAHRNMCVSHSFLTICAILHSFLTRI
jgi:hypothetical protein